MRGRRSAIRGMMFAAVLMGAGCASAGPPSPRGPSDTLPQSTVRFLEAANTGDLHTMARIFGTSRGSVADQTGPFAICALHTVGSWMRLSTPCPTWAEVELRMHAISLVLRHDSYRITTQRVVPGRSRPTVEILLDLDRGGRWIEGVPLQVVQRPNGVWMVESIGLERITERGDL
jgi:hypothetical protein